MISEPKKEVIDDIYKTSKEKNKTKEKKSKNELNSSKTQHLRDKFNNNF